MKALYFIGVILNSRLNWPYLLILILFCSCKGKMDNVVNAISTPTFSTCNLQTTALSTTSIQVMFEAPAHAKKIKLLRDGVEIFTTTDLTNNTFLDTGLEEGGVYTYSCLTATSLIGNDFLDSNSQTIGFTDVVTPPTFGGIFNATTNDYYSADVVWGAAGGTRTSFYRIYIGQGAIDFTATPAAIVSASSNLTSQTVTGLLPNTEYQVAVRACTYNNVCDSNTTTLTLTTVGYKDCNLNTTALSASSIKVDFSIPAFFKSFKLLRDGVQVFTTTDLTSTTYTDTALTEGRPYTYSCQAINELDDLVNDSVVKIGYTTISVAPTFAGIRTAVITSINSAKSFWTPPTVGVFATKYKLYVSQGASVDFSAPPVAVVSYTDSTNSRVIENLTLGTQYSFGVRACTANNLCDTNTVSKTLTVANDMVPPVVTPVFNVIRDEQVLADAGITLTNHGKVWDLVVNPTDAASGVAELKIFRKLTTDSTDFSVGNEVACVDDLDTNCLASSPNVTSATLRFQNVNRDTILYVNYKIIATDGFGNETVVNKSYNAQYPLQVATGESHTCTLFNHGGVWCWGRGTEGQLGYPGRANLSSGAGTAGYVNIIDATNDPGATKVVKIAARSNRTCALLDTGKIKCWGQGRYIEPSRGAHWGVFVTTSGNHNIPVINYYNQFSYDSTLDANSYFNFLTDTSLVPKDIVSYELHAGAEIGEFDMSDNIQCATASTGAEAGKLKCWGKPVYSSRFFSASAVNTRHGHHQPSCLLGNDPSDTPAAPKTSDTQWQFLNWIGYINENWNRCSNGNQYPANNNFVTTTGIVDETIVDFSVGNRHACAVFEKTNGENNVRCWGGEHNNSSGTESDYNNLLGVGGRWYGLGKPVNGLYVPILSNDPLVPGAFVKDQILDIANSGSGSCVLLAPTLNSAESNNKIRCWGNNSYGQYGIGNTTSIVRAKNAYSTTNNTAPTVAAPVNFGTDINPQQLYSFKNGHSYCALDDNHNVYCWGENSVAGQLGSGLTTNIIGSTAITTPVATASKVLSIDMGTNHVCAVLMSGEIQCWGANASGQHGYASSSLLAPDATKTPDIGYVP